MSDAQHNGMPVRDANASGMAGSPGGSVDPRDARIAELESWLSTALDRLVVLRDALDYANEVYPRLHREREESERLRAALAVATESPHAATLARELGLVRSKIERLKRVVDGANRSLAEKNRELDALHYVWCRPGCRRGLDRDKSHPALTTDDVLFALAAVRRMACAVTDREATAAVGGGPINTEAKSREYERVRRAIREELFADPTKLAAVVALEGRLQDAEQARDEALALLSQALETGAAECARLREQRRQLVRLTIIDAAAIDAALGERQGDRT